MSKSRTVKLRQAFEERNGFIPRQRTLIIYKSEWRKFKKDWKRGRL